jgi:hypothetical protein
VEIICDSVAEMNSFEGTDFTAAAEMAADFLPDLKEAVLESKKESRGPPAKNVEGKASRDIADIYTATDDFIRDVAFEDRSAFTSHLFSQTKGMKDGEAKGIRIFGAKRIYFFFATGEMTGKVYKSVSNKRLNLYKKIYEEFLNETKQSGEGPALWAEFDSLKEGGDISNTSLSGYGRTTVGNDTLSEKSSLSNSARSYERSGEYNHSAQEVEDLVLALKKLHISSASADAKNSGELNGHASIDLTSMDADYMSAVESGDMETAQKMVDEALGDINAEFLSVSKRRPSTTGRSREVRLRRKRGMRLLI